MRSTGAEGRANAFEVTKPKSVIEKVPNPEPGNAADYVIWRKSDGTQNGYATWRENFGQSTSSSATIAA